MIFLGFLGFPANLLQPDVKKELQELLKQSNEQSLEMLFCYCITLLLDELHQGMCFTDISLYIL